LLLLLLLLLRRLLLPARAERRHRRRQGRRPLLLLALLLRMPLGLGQLGQLSLPRVPGWPRRHPRQRLGQVVLASERGKRRQDCIVVRPCMRFKAGSLYGSSFPAYDVKPRPCSSAVTRR